MEISKEYGYKKIILYTQTTTCLVVKLYLDFLFEVK